MKYLCFDIGGSSIKWAVSDEDYHFLKKGKVVNSFADRESFLNGLLAVRDTCGEVIDRIAISYCGELDSETGYIYLGGAYSYNGSRNLKLDLEKLSGLSVWIEKDSHCAALAELVLGGLRSYQNAVVLTLGTAVGCSIIIDRKIHHGAHFCSGLASECIMNVDGEYDRQNTAAYSVSSRHLMETYTRASGKSTLIDGKDFFQKVCGQEELAVSIFRDYCKRTAAFIFNLQMILNAKAFLIGGGISAQQILIDMLREEFDQFYTREPLNKLSFAKPVIDRCEFDNDAGLYGALICASRQES